MSIRSVRKDLKEINDLKDPKERNLNIFDKYNIYCKMKTQILTQI
jgi:hypothetical protein